MKAFLCLTPCPFPVYLQITHPWFLYHSEGKKILGTPRVRLSISTYCQGPISIVTDTSSEHQASLLPGQKS